MPSTSKIIPLQKSIVAIKLGHPATEKSPRSALLIMIAIINIEKVENRVPVIIANFNGRSEKEIMTSKASLNRFLIEYEGEPLNLLPCLASIVDVEKPNHFIVLT